MSIGSVKFVKITANDYEPKTVMKILREWTDKTQEQFGKDICLSRITVQKYENGERRYSFETLMEIAKKYGMTVTIEKK